ncbi:MAG: heavy-metal-associated domain-containing protein [Acidimicrobiia bacterium]
MSPIEQTYTVEGMTCGHCEMSVREEVEGVAGVESAQADHRTGELVVRGVDVDPAAVRRAVEEAGNRLTAGSA